MAVGLKAPQELLPVAGVELAAGAFGIKANGRADMVLMRFAEGSRVAGVFTRNAFCAAPVQVARAHLAHGDVRAFVINAGNANAGTGQAGLRDARESCLRVAAVLGIEAGAVLPFSTGVIGENLPMERLHAGIETLGGQLAADNWLAAAEAIMTTDTVAKGASRTVSIGGESVTLTGIAKGSGMIHPDMATMLAFVATDAVIETERLQALLRDAVAVSFNAVSVDGDTSTNDACMLVASGASGVHIDAGGEAAQAFAEALTSLCTELAQAIVRDGEGASKFVRIDIEQAASVEEARQLAFTIAHSPLVKTALYASDPNWGRILAAIGRAGLADLDIGRVVLYLDEVCIVRDGGRAPEYTEAAGQAVMDRDELTIRVLLGRGEAATTVWTCDLSHDYVTINAEYRT